MSGVGWLHWLDRPGWMVWFASFPTRYDLFEDPHLKCLGYAYPIIMKYLILEIIHAASITPFPAFIPTSWGDSMAGNGSMIAVFA